MSIPQTQNDAVVELHSQKPIMPLAQVTTDPSHIAIPLLPTAPKALVDPVSPASLPKKKTWTSANKTTLLGVASRRGASIKTFEGAIDGRSGLACYIQWKHVILPGLKVALSRGDGAKTKANKGTPKVQKKPPAKKIKVEEKQ